jgi:PhzF family phenazine biosynthesis protein
MKTYFVDSFTNEKFKGNPAAVCIIESDLDNTTRQNIAAEIGFSETSFVKEIDGNTYSIRFYTPKKEIPLCGHATLASSKIIFDTTTLENINFINGQDLQIKVRKAAGEIVMEFPIYDTFEIDVPEAMLNAIGIDETVEKRFNPETKIILIEISDPDVLANLKPNFKSLMDSYSGIDGVLLTARCNDCNFDFHYRYFWPWAGTNEDPVTGGVQTFLTKYWANKLHKNRLFAFQSSLRTGSMITELFEDKVLIYGEAVTVFEGEFNI